MTMRLDRAALLAVAVLILLPLQAGSAQSLLDRPPNVAGGWVGRSGAVYFNFLHRFSVSPVPERKVSNVPTFTIAAGLPARTLVGANYATNSQLATRYPNEWEFFARTLVFAQDAGSPVDLAAQAGYNLASDGVDAEFALARRAGPVRLIAAARIMADPFQAGRTRFAPAAGATLRLTRHLALAGDVATIIDPRPDERLAWSAGVHVALPLTPHTLSLHASNTNAATLQGASRGERRARYGFEFTVPVTLARYVSRTPAAVAAVTPPDDSVATDESAATAHAAHSGARPEPRAHATPDVAAERNAAIRGLAFAPDRIEIAAGMTVVWKNEDPVPHTVTSATGAFDSGMIEPGETWRYTFERPGTYAFFCAPHPFMKGTVVVR
jgi:plastocyanin